MTTKVVSITPAQFVATTAAVLEKLNYRLFTMDEINSDKQRDEHIWPIMCDPDRIAVAMTEGDRAPVIIYAEVAPSGSMQVYLDAGQPVEDEAKLLATFIAIGEQHFAALLERFVTSATPTWMDSYMKREPAPRNDGGERSPPVRMVDESSFRPGTPSEAMAVDGELLDRLREEGRVRRQLENDELKNVELPKRSERRSPAKGLTDEEYEARKQQLQESRTNPESAAYKPTPLSHPDLESSDKE